MIKTEIYIIVNDNQWVLSSVQRICGSISITNQWSTVVSYELHYLFRTTRIILK